MECGFLKTHQAITTLTHQAPEAQAWWGVGSSDSAPGRKLKVAQRHITDSSHLSQLSDQMFVPRRI